MKKEDSLNQLLAAACPAIQYRVLKELLKQPSDLPEMLELQKKILQDEAVKKVISSQSADGWLAWNFHGYESMESGMRLLCEKGLEPGQPVLADALLALDKHANRLERGFGKPGKILDELGFGGAETIRAYLFAQAGKEETVTVQKQIEQALQVFKSIIPITDLECLYEKYKGSFVFRENVCWPSIYHLRLLALTQSWRTPANLKMIAESIQQLVRFSPIPAIHVKYQSQIIAPPSFCMDDFSPDMEKLTDAKWMQWFHRMELLARLGVLKQIPELKRQVQGLEHLLLENSGTFNRKLRHVYFQKWGSYTGLALEKDWRVPQRRINDLTFRSFLILHYADLS